MKYAILILLILSICGCQSTALKNSVDEQQVTINELQNKVNGMESQLKQLQREMDNLRKEVGNVEQHVKKPPYVEGNLQEGVN